MQQHIQQLVISHTSTLLQEAISHPIISSIRETILSQQPALKLIWTPSHRGIPVNELADVRAKEAAIWQPAPLKPSQLETSSTRSGNMSPKTGIHMGKTCQKIRNSHIKPMPSFWRSSVPISRKLEIFLHRLCLGCTYPTHLHFLTNHPVPACPLAETLSQSNIC